MRTSELKFLIALAALSAGDFVAAQTPTANDLLPSNSTLSGPGRITASPTQPAEDNATGKHALPMRSTSVPARVFGNGTQMSYGQSGANAIGNTGGLTTGPRGSAGAVAGGGGVHSGALVIPPGPANASMHSDERRERLPGAANDQARDNTEPGVAPSPRDDQQNSQQR